MAETSLTFVLSRKPRTTIPRYNPNGILNESFFKSFANGVEAAVYILQNNIRTFLNLEYVELEDGREINFSGKWKDVVCNPDDMVVIITLCENCTQETCDAVKQLFDGRVMFTNPNGKNVKLVSKE